MITSSDLKVLLSGGASNADPDASLGGAVSSVELVDNTLNNLFDTVVGQESQTGDKEYRCIYIKNNHATLSLINPVVYVASQTTSETTDLKISVATETGSPVQSLPNENTQPSGQTFVLADGESNAISLGSDLAPGEVKALWVEWDITAGTVAIIDSATIQVRGETNP